MGRRVWVACSNGEIRSLRIRGQTTLQQESSPVQPALTAYSSDSGDRQETWQSERCGINVLAVRPDLRLVAAARWDHRVELFDSKTAASLGRLQCHDKGVLCAAFDRERGALATGSEDGRIALWGALSETYMGPFVPKAE